MEDQVGANGLVLHGDFSIVGIDEQFPLLVQHVAGLTEIVRDRGKPTLPYRIDLSGVCELDTCGCQLLATLFRSLRRQGIDELSLRLNDELREKIHSLGFDKEILAGECV